MDLITLSALGAAANTASDSGGGGGGAVAERTDDQYANTILLVHGDGNPGANNLNNPAPEAQYLAISDDGPNDQQLQIEGTNVHGTNFSPWYYSDGFWSVEFFGGTPDYITVPNSVIDVSGNPITVECFLYIAGPDAFQPVWGLSNGGGGSSKINLHDSGDGALTIEQTVGGGNFSTATSVRAAIQNKWAHVAFVREGTGTNESKLYVNGDLSATGTVSGNLTGWTGAFRIGRNPEDYSTALDGYISNFKITHAAVYTSAFTAPTSPLTTTSQSTSASDVKLLTLQSNRFKDNSLSKFDLEPTGTPRVSVFTPFPNLVSDTSNTQIYSSANTGSIYLDGTGYVAANDTTQKYTFGTEDFTYELWCYDMSTDTGQRGIMTRQTGGNRTEIYFYKQPTSEILGLYYSSLLVSSTRKIRKNEWTHIALCRENGTSRIFMNGELQGSAADTNNLNTPTRLIIGAGDGAISQPWIGYLSDIRVEKGRAKYTSNTSFHPNLQPPSYANTSNSGTIATNQFSTFFDGSDHLANTNPIPVNDFAFRNSNDFTIEMWFNATGLPGSDMLLYDARVANGAYPAIILNSAKKILWYVNTAAAITSRALSTGKWYHLAIVRSGNSTTMYLDGLREGDVYTDSVNYSHGDINISLNQPSGGQQFQGQIHGLNILNGVPKYTANTQIQNTPFTTVGTAPVNNHSVEFDGNSDNLTTAASSDFAFGTGDFTVECWAFPKSIPSVAVILDLRYNNNSSTDNISAITLFSGVLGCYIGANKTAGSDIPVKINSWQHLCIQRISGTLYFAVNGKMSSTTVASTDNLNNASARATIGGNVDQTTVSMYTGQVSNLRIIKGTGVYGTGDFLVPTEPVSNTSQGATASEVSLIACQANTFIDNSDKNHSMTNKNSAISTFNPYDNGYWSVHFDGTDDYLDIPSVTSALSGQWSLELWFKKQDSSTDIIVSTDTTDQFQLNIQDSGDFHFSYNGTSPVFDVASGTSLNEWFHICITRDGSNNIRGYIDGVMKGHVYNTGTPTLNGFSVGDQRTTGSHDTFGKVSNLRLVVGSIPTTYATANSSFTPPTDYLTTTSQGATASDVKLLICQSGSFIDKSTGNNAITISGDTRISRSRPFSTELSRDQILLACQDKEVTKDNSYLNLELTKTGDVIRSADNPFDDGYWSGQFDGTSDRLTIPNSTNTNLGGITEDYTLECWFRLSTITSAARVLFGMSNGGGSVNKWGIGINMNSSAAYSANKVGFFAVNGTAGDGDYGPGFVASQWYHFRLIYTHSNTTLKIYINGAEVVSVGANLPTSTGLFTIGTDGEANNPFIGNISNVRLVKGTALDTTVPTAPLTAITNTVLLTCQSSNFVDKSNSLLLITEIDNANTRPVFPFANTEIAQQTTLLTGKYRGSIRNVGFIDESANACTLTTVGTDVSQGSFGPHYPPDGWWCAEFDGGSNIYTADHDDYDLGTNDFTIGVWVFPQGSALSGRTAIACMGTSGYVPFILAHDELLISFDGSSWTTISFSTDIVNNRWQWLQVDRNGNNFYVYIDGAQVGTATSSSAIMAAAAGVNLGTRDGQTAFKGYMSNFILINGARRSVTTAPTAPLTSTGAQTKLLALQSNRFKDNGSIDHDLTLAGNAGGVRIKPFYPFKLETSYDPYDHGGSYLGEGDGNAVKGFLSRPLGTGDFTIGAWVYRISGGDNDYFFSFRTGADNDAAKPAFGFNGSQKVIVYTSSGGPIYPGSNITLRLKEWTYVKFYRKSGTLYCMVNGNERFSSDSGSYSTDLTNKFFAFGGNTNATECWNGYISNLYVLQGYADESTTVPTAPRNNTYQFYSNSVAFLCNATNGGIYDSTGKNILTPVTEAQISTGAANTKFGTGSLYFDGNDYIKIPESETQESLFTAKDQDFTWEAFVKFEELSGLHTLWSKYGSGSEYQFYYDSSNNDWRLSYHASTYDWDDDEIETHKWYHIALVKDGTNHSVFRDGKRKGPVRDISYPTQRDREFVLGSTFNGPNSQIYGFNGFLDEVRVTKNFARYTANFTPMIVASGNKSANT